MPTVCQITVGRTFESDDLWSGTPALAADLSVKSAIEPVLRNDVQLDFTEIEPTLTDPPSCLTFRDFVPTLLSLSRR
jgi:hypothetical protein